MHMNACVHIGMCWLEFGLNCIIAIKINTVIDLCTAILNFQYPKAPFLLVNLIFVAHILEEILYFIISNIKEEARQRKSPRKSHSQNFSFAGSSLVLEVVGHKNVTV